MMKTRDEIFDDINEYEHNLSGLIADLRSVGITSYAAFDEAADEVMAQVKRTIREYVAANIGREVPPPPPPPSPGPVPPPLPSNNQDESVWNIAQTQNTVEAYQIYLDSCPDGKYRGEARCRIENLTQVSTPALSEDEIVWAGLNKNNEATLENFITSYPDSKCLREARKRLNEIRVSNREKGIEALLKHINSIKTDSFIIDRGAATYQVITDFLDNGKVTLAEFIDAMTADRNLINGAVAKKLYDEGYVTDSDYLKTGIGADVVDYMVNPPANYPIPPSPPLYRISKSPCTEIYFWGIPSSGKSCALGAILSVANNGKVAKTMERDGNCQGYGYMTRLANLFSSNSVGSLPPGTPITSTYEMGMNLVDDKDRIHPIACVDLAGELIECMYRYDAGEPLTDEQSIVLKTMTDVLIDNKTDNQKIHFFVIEYGAEDRLYKGLPQSVYLDAAVAYINKTGIFKKKTDALFVLVSKIDKVAVHDSEFNSHMSDYLASDYASFINGLKKICKDNEINDGKLEVYPFTLGEVNFQTYCKFKPEAATSIVQLLLDKTFSYKSNKWEKIQNKFRG